MITQLGKHYSAVFKEATKNLYVSYFRGYTSTIVVNSPNKASLGIHKGGEVVYNISCHSLDRALYAYMMYFRSLAPIYVTPIRWLYGDCSEGLKQDYTIYSPTNMYLVEVPRNFGESISVSPESTLKASAYIVTGDRVPLYSGEFRQVYHKVQQTVLKDYLDKYIGYLQ